MQVGLTRPASWAQRSLAAGACALWCTAALAQERGRLILLRSAGDAAESAIELVGDRPLSFTTLKLRAPPRVVVDLAETDLALEVRDLPVDDGTIRRVAAAPAGRKTARVVIELAAEGEFAVRAYGSIIEVRVPRAALLAKAQPPAAQQASEVAPPAPGEAQTGARADLPKTAPSESPPPVAGSPAASPDTRSAEERSGASTASDGGESAADRTPSSGDRASSSSADRAETAAVDRAGAAADRAGSSADRAAAAADRAQTAAADRAGSSADPRASSEDRAAPSAAASSVAVQRSQSSTSPPLPEAPGAAASGASEVKDAAPAGASPAAAKPDDGSGAGGAAAQRAGAQAESDKRASLPRVALTGPAQQAAPHPAAARKGARGHRPVADSAGPAITGIGFRPIGDGQVVVRSDRPLEVTASGGGDALVLHFSSAVIPLPNNRRPLDTRFFNGPVERVVPLVVASGTDLRIELRARADYQLAQSKGVLTVTFSVPR